MSEDITLETVKKQEGIKTLFLYLGNAASSFYRIVQPAMHMVDVDGIVPIIPKFDSLECDKKFREFETNPQKHINTIRKLWEVADVIIVSCSRNTEFVALLKALKELYGKPIITECDDNQFSLHGDHQGHSLIGEGSDIEFTIFNQIKMSDHVICSTEYLRNSLSKLNCESSVIPNAINPTLWGFEKKPNELIRIGWAGASNHFRDLYLIKKAMGYILDKYKNVEFHCLHGAPNFLIHPRFHNDNEWTPIDSYPAKLASMNFDIALAPLWDSEFNRSKSNLRYLEYSILKIPTIASDVEPYSKTITDGVDGFLFDDTKILVDKIEYLISNEDERKKIAENAFLKVGQINSPFNSLNVAHQYGDFIKSFYKEWCKNVQLPDNPD